MAKYRVGDLSYDELAELLEDDELYDNVCEDMLDLAQAILTDTALDWGIFDVTFDGPSIRDIRLKPNGRDKLLNWLDNYFYDFIRWSDVLDDETVDEIVDEVNHIVDDPNYSARTLEYLLSNLERFLPQDFEDFMDWIMSYPDDVIDTDTKTIEPEE